MRRGCLTEAVKAGSSGFSGAGGGATAACSAVMNRNVSFTAEDLDKVLRRLADQLGRHVEQVGAAELALHAVDPIMQAIGRGGDIARHALARAFSRHLLIGRLGLAPVRVLAPDRGRVVEADPRLAVERGAPGFEPMPRQKPRSALRLVPPEDASG